MRRIMLLVFCIWCAILVQAQKYVNIDFDSVECVQDTLTKTYYYSVTSDITRLSVRVDYENTDSLFIENIFCSQGSIYTFSNIKLKKQYTVQIYDKKSGGFHNATLVFTTLPLVCLDTHGVDIIKDERTVCQFILIDPLRRLPEQRVVFDHLSGIKVRGSSSSIYPKKSYSVELQDDNGDEVDASLLNLREDGDWILDAMYIDHARMRNRLCTDLWNSFNTVPHKEDEPEAINGTRGYFVEVILNKKYNGLYCLTEKVDRKQLKLKKYDDKYRGVSYKANTWNTLLGNGAYDETAPLFGLEWNGYESEYPGEESLAGWEYLKDFLEFCSPRYTDDQMFAKHVVEHVNLDNIVDYTIFINAVYALDNAVKNMYLSVYNVQKDSCFFITPWDLDATFGRSYEGSVDNRYAFEGEVPFSNVLISRLYDKDVEQFRTRLQERWRELRKSSLSVDSVAMRIDRYKNIFETSGAFQREMTLWPEKCSELTSETTFMKYWYTKNYDVMDNFILGEPLKIDCTDSFSNSIKLKGHEVSINLTSDYKADIFDVSGRLVRQLHSVTPLTFTVPESGVYIIRIYTNNSQASYKIIIP